MRKAIAIAAFALGAAPLAAHAEARVYEADALGTPLSLDLYGWVQPRFSYQQQDTRPTVNFTPNPAFTVNRARIGAIATFGLWGRAQVEMELAHDNVQTMDAYIVASPVHEKNVSLNFTFGQFRVPFSRQNLLSSKSYQFADNAYFITPKYIVDRDIGAQISAEFLEGRGRIMAGVFNGNDPGRGQALNTDAYLLFAGRAEISPFGAAPRFEGDLRPLEERHRPLLTLGGGAMRNHQQDKYYERTYLGADLGFWWEGFSLYAEYYHRLDKAALDAPTGQIPPEIHAEGVNAQIGYFPPLPIAREHLEVVFRFERFDPNETTRPSNDSGERDLDQSNPTWGYMGFVFGLNAFADRGHNLKLQTSYEVRNETTRCLVGQTGAGCTGYIKNNLFLLQATAAF